VREPAREVEAESVELTTTQVQRRDLAEFEELDGTLEFAEGITFDASTNGSLTFLAAEGTVLERGDVVAVVSDELTELERAQIAQSVASAESQVASARNSLSSVLEGASASEIASAEAAVLAAQTSLDDLLEPPSENAVTQAGIAVEDARSALNDTLDGVDEEDLRPLRQLVDQAEASLRSAQNGVDTALISALTAQNAFCDLDPLQVEVCDSDDLPLSSSEIDALTSAVDAYLADGDSPSAQVTQSFVTANASYDNALASLSSARNNLEVAEANLADAEAGASDDDIAKLRLALSQAVEAYEDLVGGPSETRIALAQADLATAQAQLADLVAGADSAARSSAYAALESAQANLATQHIQAAEQLAAGPRPAVLMYGSAPAWREMDIGSSPGPDIEQLESNLASLGFDAEGTLVADGIFDDATAAAVTGWQESLGIEPTGDVPLGSVVFVAGPSLVEDQLATLGATVNPGLPLLALTPTRSGEELLTTQRIVAQLPLSDRSLLDIDSTVTIELPDGTQVTAVVVGIGNVPLGGEPGGSDAYVEVEIRPDEPIDEVWIGASVDVAVTAELAEDALSVPVSALLALVEGGYAIEVPEGDGTRLVGVETGMFADGFVEITGEGIIAGLEVVVPR
jgi:peptidoglycan hydrolase-like protein with peptidoglycan-binding domain